MPVRRPSLGEADGTGVRVPARRPSYGARDGNTTPMHRASFALREAEANSVKTPARRPSHQFREELKEMPYQMLNDISSNYSANIIPEQRKLSINEKNEKAMDAIAQITNLNRQSAEFLSIKISTEEALIKMKSDAPIRSSSVDAYETQTMQPFHQSTAVESIQSGVDSLRVVDGTNEKPSEEPVADSPQRTDGEISNLEKPAVVQHADAEGNANVDNKETNESVQHDLPKPQTPQSKRIEKVPVELE